MVQLPRHLGEWPGLFDSLSSAKFAANVHEVAIVARVKDFAGFHGFKSSLEFSLCVADKYAVS